MLAVRTRLQVSLWPEYEEAFWWPTHYYIQCRASYTLWTDFQAPSSYSFVNYSRSSMKSNITKWNQPPNNCQLHFCCSPAVRNVNIVESLAMPCTVFYAAHLEAWPRSCSVNKHAVNKKISRRKKDDKPRKHGWAKLYLKCCAAVLQILPCGYVFVQGSENL